MRRLRSLFCLVNAACWGFLAGCAAVVLCGEWDRPPAVLGALVCVVPCTGLAIAELWTWRRAPRSVEMPLGVVSLVAGVILIAGVVANAVEAARTDSSAELPTTENSLLLAGLLTSVGIVGVYLVTCGGLRLRWLWRGDFDSTEQRARADGTEPPGV